MPGAFPTGTSRAFGLYIQGVNLTRYVPADSVRITETAGESNAVLTFEIEYPGGSSLGWLTGLSQDVELKDLTNARRLFRGNLVNVRRSHMAKNDILLSCTCVSYDAWLDRLVLPRWVSRRPNGVAMSSDREMVQAVTAAVAATPPGQFAWDAINTYVASTNTNMPLVKVQQGGSVRDILGAIAEAAATAADPTARNFYIDFDNHLHYFKGNENTFAPYRLGDASYLSTVKATSGLVSLWSLNEASGATAYDAMGYAHMTLSGPPAYNQPGGVVNEPHMTSIAFDGSTDFGSASGTNLHPGDTFSFECWFKRAAPYSTTQVLIDSQANNDYLIFLNGSNQIVANKRAVGTWFQSSETTADSSWHHLVITKNGATREAYLDGTGLTNTAANQTLVAGATTIKLATDGTNFFHGWLQDVAIYNTAMPQLQAKAHYFDGITIVPDYIDFETEINGAGMAVYVKGGTSSGTGWVVPTPQNAAYRQAFLLDRPESTTSGLKTAIGTAFLKRDANEIYGGHAQITMAASTWRAGQTVTIDDAGLGVDGTVTGIGQTYQIKQLETAPNLGSGMVTYDIYFGALPWSGTFAIQRKRRRHAGG